MSAKKPMIILLGPSGVGKSTLLERALRDFPSLVDTVTFTTRSMRPGESEGNPYHFVTRAEFESRIAQGFFVEWAEVHNNLYGTPQHQIDDAWVAGKAIIMDVDVQGAKTFLAKFPHATAVFILPPSIEALRHRLQKRDGKPPKDLELRLKNAEKEIAQSGSFEHRLTNENFDQTYASFKKIIEKVISSR